MWPFRRKDNRIAIVAVEGIISDSQFGASQSKIIRALEQARRSRARAIVLRINSPGGTVGACQEIYSMIKRIRREGKPVVTSMGDLAASGGVYIGVAADRIVANPGTVTGSIGVIIKAKNLRQLYQKVGVDSQVIKSGEFKDILSTDRSMTEEERTLLQAVTDDTHKQFIEAVAENRKMSLEQVLSFADGRIFTGRQAKEMGLVDELGGLQTAIDEAAKLAGIKGRPRLVRIAPVKTIWQRILGPFSAISDSWEVGPSLSGIPLWLMPR